MITVQQNGKSRAGKAPTLPYCSRYKPPRLTFNMRRYRNICPKIPVSYRSLYGLPNGVLGDVNVTSPSTTSPAEFSFSTAAGFLPYQRTNEQATSQLHDHQARKPSSEVFHGAGSRCEADRNTHDRGTTSSTGDTSQAAKGSSRWSSHMVVPPPKATLTDTAWAILPEASETILIDPGSLEYPTSLPSPCRSNGMLSPMSTSSSYSNVAYLSSSDDSEPFDATEETERLMKIHDLAEKIVAREAASRGKVHVESPKNEDVVPSDNNFSASLTSLATSSLMPLAVAAGTSQRAPTARSPGASSGKSLIPSIDLSPSFHQSLGTAAAVPTAECKHTSTRSATISCCVRKETINCDGDKSAASTLPVPEPLRTSVNGRGRRRKLATPTKSPRPDDPGFRGAVVRMQLEIVGGKPQLKLEHCFK